MMIKFKFLELKKVFDVSQSAGEQVVHSRHQVSFPDKPVAEVGA
jgi:hypothetical protein